MQWVFMLGVVFGFGVAAAYGVARAVYNALTDPTEERHLKGLYGDSPPYTDAELADIVFMHTTDRQRHSRDRQIAVEAAMSEAEQKLAVEKAVDNQEVEDE